MTRKKVNKILWHGNDLNEDGSAKAPSVASYAGALDGLNPGELYICDADGAPTLFMVTDSGRVVPIGGVNSDELKKLFLRKDTNDRTPFKLEVGDKLTAEKGLQISKNFVSGIIGGSGGYIYLDENGKVVIETDKAVFREEMITPKITFNCIDVISGDKANTFAFGTFKDVDTESRIATLDLLDNQWGTSHVSDICRGIFHNIGGSNTEKDTIGANGFIEYSGYATSYFTPTRILENEAGNMKFEYELQVGTNIHPMPGMNFFAYGNFKDKDRQAITYENRYYTRRLAHVNTWVIDPEVNVMMQTGDLSGLSIGGMDFSGYSFYGKNVYISGTIERLKPNGTPAKDLSYEGVWESGRKYDYYDSVTHDGSTWACMNKDGSSAEPGTNNDWQKIASKGDKGDPGESAVFADLTNEMDNVTLTNDGKVYQDTSISTVVWMSYGSKKMTLTGITCALPANVTETHDVSTGEITFSVKQGVALDGRNPIPVALTATYNGKAYTGQLTFTLAGVKGGADAVLYRLVPSVSAVIKDANGNLNVTSVSCTRLKSSVSGGTAETGTGELKYSLDGGAEVSIGNNAGVPVSSFQKSIKFIFYVDGTVVDVETIPLVVDGKDGAQGPQGVPGPAGADGKTLYTWIKYADDAQGGGISNNPTGKAYIGFAYNKETATESNNPSDYTWSDIKGEDGIPGATGADGKTYYTWVAYSDNADGTGMYQQPKDTTKYIGIAVNKETATESNNPSDYTWSKFKGEDGQSVSSLGRWHTGLIVPKLGIVTMGGSTFCAKKETTNPPLWTTTTNDGRRITQTQDGGKTYGYILSGESNTEEYDLLVQSGKDGSDGTDYERVFIHTTEENRPSTPATSQTDDYIPSGWHDDPIGVSESLPFEWISEREKKNGVWGNFSTPALWAKYGFDGKGVKYVDVLYAISTSNTTAPTTGWQTDAPAWENGKYIWSKTVTTYSDNSVEETSPVCITGGAGATGKGVKTITEYYYMSTSPTTLTGGSWSTTRPTWENGKYIWTKSIITYTDNTTSETPGICVTGEKGDSITSLGRWHTGLIVPKLGIVTMGGSTFCAKKETTNPPLWTTTTNDGRRITQTQDGGKTYGYILSGESNTEEYDLLVQSGKDGSDGTDYERVFIHTTEENRPSTPATSQTDDYIPSGWHDDPIGVSESLPFEWISEREKKNGVWGNFSTPALWAKYGFDGKGVKYVDVLYAISTSNTTAPTTGWQTDAPAWENGKYIWSKTVTTYSDNSVEETSPVCITGGAGATGKGVKTITEYYYMSTSPTTLTGGSWSTTRPTWENGKYIWTKSIITYTDNTTSETPGICVTGEKGDSITSLGRWYTGLIVPKQGVVNMGGSSYIAKKETTNPPLWTVTTSSGQRIKQTQDGGKTYGYILSGEMNSAEYDLLASKGEDGKPGADGKPGTDGKPGEKGEQGIQGCIIRHSEWAVGVTYRNDEALTSGTRYLDIAMIKNLATIDGWDVYRCKTTHTSSESNKPGNTTYWEKLSNVGPIFTSLIIAKNGSINFFQGNQFLIKNSANKPVLGMTGGDHEGYITDVRLWIDEENGMYPDRAKFRVYKSGRVVATDVDLTGTINAISGTIAGFKISGTSISSTDGAYDGGSGPNSYSNSKFFLHADGSGSAFMGFSATGKWVGIGLNCLPSTSGGRQALGRFYNTTAESYVFDKIGLLIEISGALTYDDIGYGNSALYIPKGHITGFRRRFRRVSTSTTLTNMDSIVRLVNTAEITVTLPAGCEDGQEIWLCSGNEKKVNVRAASGDSITGDGGSFATNRWHIYIYDAHNRDWVYGYTN